MTHITFKILYEEKEPRNFLILFQTILFDCYYHLAATSTARRTGSLTAPLHAFKDLFCSANTLSYFCYIAYRIRVGYCSVQCRRVFNVKKARLFIKLSISNFGEFSWLLVSSSFLVWVELRLGYRQGVGSLMFISYHLHLNTTSAFWKLRYYIRKRTTSKRKYREKYVRPK